MWAGRTSGLPALAAACTAELNACCVLVVGVKLSTRVHLSLKSNRLKYEPYAVYNANRVECIPLKAEVFVT